ncbi:MAG: hypothetical protein C5S48_00170 [Candidatus Methanogaster sp.]|nr:MAG: hypothetical protein C5S48_00170 [ANME-2 cluster archaeon]
MLERYEGKLSCTVLRRGEAGNRLVLSRLIRAVQDPFCRFYHGWIGGRMIQILTGYFLASPKLYPDAEFGVNRYNPDA